MKRNLNLSIDEQIIEKAKVYAQANGRSLSEIIENTLVAMSADVDLDTISPRTHALLGSVKTTDKRDYKETLAEEIANKHR